MLAVVEGTQRVEEVATTTKTKTISDAVTRRVKAAVGVQNLTWSEGYSMPAGLPNEARAGVMAQLYLRQCGFGNDASFEAASETLGWALAELWADQSTIRAMDWEMLAVITAMTVRVFASAKDTRFPAGARADRESTMFIARGQSDNYFLVLNPLRVGEGTAEEFVAEQLKQWTTKQAQVVIELADEDEVGGARGGAKRKRAELGRPSTKVSEEEDRTKRSREFADFEVAEAHPVLEEWGEFDNFKKEMRQVNAREPIVWEIFIGERLIKRLVMQYRVQYKADFNKTKMSKTVFLARMEELRDLETTGVVRSMGEPRLYNEPGAVKDFINDFLEYRSRNEAKNTPLGWCERLLYRIADKRREWAAEIQKGIGMWRTEESAEGCFLTICKRLEGLEEEEATRKQGIMSVEGPVRRPWQNRAISSPQGQIQPVGAIIGGPSLGKPPPPAEEPPGRGGLPAKKEGFKCYNCDDPGHGSYQCPHPKRCNICGALNHLAYACDGSGPKGKREAAAGGALATGEQGTQATKQYVPPGAQNQSSRVAFATTASGGGQRQSN